MNVLLGLLRLTLLTLLGVIYQMWIAQHGFVPESTNALLQHTTDFLGGFADDQAGAAPYPLLTYAVLALTEALFGFLPIATPFIASALIASLLILSWKSLIRDEAGYSRGATLLILMLLVLNPLFLRVLSHGPDQMLLLAGMALLARGMVSLRISGAAPDILKVSTGLFIVALSTSYGLILVVSALPFLLISARKENLVASPVGYLLTLLFPVLMAMASILILSVQSDTSLIDAVVQTEDTPPYPTVAILGASLIPMILFYYSQARVRSGASVAVMAAFGTCMLAIVLNHATPLQSDPLLLLAPVLAAFMPAMALLKQSRLRSTGVVMSLIISCGAGLFAAGLGQQDPNTLITALGELANELHRAIQA
jgi:hypothetical protein